MNLRYKVIGPYAELTFIAKCAAKCATECIVKFDDILNAYLAAHLEVNRHFLPESAIL